MTDLLHSLFTPVSRLMEQLGILLVSWQGEKRRQWDLEVSLEASVGK